jgi:hypothetical protein
VDWSSVNVFDSRLNNTNGLTRFIELRRLQGLSSREDVIYGDDGAMLAVTYDR